MSKTKSNIISLIIIFAVFAFLFSKCSSSRQDKPTSTEPTTETTTETTTEVQSLAKNINYEIKEVNDVSFSNVVRKDLRVLVNNPEIVEQEDFEALCQKIVIEYTDTTPVNALTLFLCIDERDFSRGGYTFGKCTYYPNGDIGDAANVKTGDYSSFKYTYNFKKKDFSKKPTNEEFDIYYYFMELFDKTDGSDEYEAKCIENTTQKFNITAEEFEEVFTKVSTFLFLY